MPWPTKRRDPLQSIPGFAGGNLSEQLKRDQIFNAMKESINPPSDPPAFPVPASPDALPQPEDLRELNYPAERKPLAPIRIHVGADTKGLQGIDKSIAELKTEQQAARDYPSSEVRDGEILPPTMHHGAKDRLKSIGKGIIISMGEYAKTHPGASAAELLSAGGTGGVIGGVSPVSIDALQRQAGVQQHEKELKGQIGIETGQAQLEGLKAKPVLEAERIRMEGEQKAREDQRRAEEFAERQRHNRATEARPRSERQALLRTRKNADGSESTLRSLDNGQTWEELSDLTSASPPKEETDYATRAQWYYKKQSEAEVAAKAARDEADKIKIETDTSGKVTNPTDYFKREGLLKQADERDKAAQEYRDKGDEAATSKGAKPQLKTQSGDTRKGTINKEQQQRWLKDNPGKTLDDMKRLYPNAVMTN